MSIETDIFDYVVSLMGIDCSPTLQVDKSFAVQFAHGYIDTTFFDKSKVQTISLLILGKDTDQKALADEMFDICDRLNFKQNKELSMHNIEIATPPSLACFEDGFYTWSCIINVKFTKGN